MIDKESARKIIKILDTSWLNLGPEQEVILKSALFKIKYEQLRLLASEVIALVDLLRNEKGNVDTGLVKDIFLHEYNAHIAARNPNVLRQALAHRPDQDKIYPIAYNLLHQYYFDEPTRKNEKSTDLVRVSDRLLATGRYSQISKYFTDDISF